MNHKMKNKISYGIACINKFEDSLSILAIRKRCSYAFTDFVYGSYHKKMNKEAYLSMLMNGMTVNEKIIIMTMNYDAIWFYYHLSIPEIDYNNTTRYKLYQKNKQLFNESFKGDRIITLMNIIKNSKSVNTIWEIPKGRKNRNEDGLSCAIREFEEETSIKCNRITFIDHPPFRYSFCSNGVKYTYIYYLSIIRSPTTPKVKFNNKEQIIEIDNIKWINSKDLYHIKDEHLNAIFTKIIKIVKNKNIKKSHKNRHIPRNINMFAYTHSEPILTHYSKPIPPILYNNSFSVLSSINTTPQR